ncbi:SDR family oxidoreductase [Parvularcula flava]|uniref:Beta-ketoacyl-ACP reductase n=1 Tax=Aquisalinus luteolus TaxID=1566827 RepID=A0A8J3A1K6_9PROT|nr:SDR family NAD(P)-dependent oxidoreductase [Aquisalinus luteolus]NHK26737.1 SDR family oxidoreductase [Aquisalinus luteolus]GGH93261.1 beta-ketoacyl-ACP reductase [Aquisalinus luteolus]
MAGRSVIVTGVATGIGRATAMRFAGAGERVVLVCKSEEKGRALAEVIRSQGGEAVFIQAKTARKLSVHNIIAEALEAYGRVDVLAHCDGLFQSAPFLETGEDQFDALIDANLRSTFLLNQAVCKQIIKQAGETDDGGVDQARGSAIINLTTTESVTASADHAVFAATQGAVTQLTKAVSMTLAPYGARANAVGIAAIREELDEVEESKSREKSSPSTPLARKGEPEEVANTIYFLASREASYITGQSIYVDGGRLAQYRRGDRNG